MPPVPLKAGGTRRVQSFPVSGRAAEVVCLGSDQGPDGCSPPQVCSSRHGLSRHALSCGTGRAIGIHLGGERRAIRWRKQRHEVEFHTVELELAEGANFLRWRTRVGFTAAPLAYALLGQRGCLEYFDATFRGADQIVELGSNRTLPTPERLLEP
jgi:hypothetical protein